MNKEAAARRLADEVSARMAELGHTYQSLSDETALYGNRVSPSGLAKICQGRVATPHRKTKIALERALEWPPGHLSRLNGTPAARRGRAPRPEPHGFDIVIRDLTKMTEDFETFVVTLERLMANLKRAASTR